MKKRPNRKTSPAASKKRAGAPAPRPAGITKSLFKPSTWSLHAALGSPLAIGLFWTVVAMGLILRLLLMIHSPQPFGYIYDTYYDAVEVTYKLGHLPPPELCWTGYHPPLFYLLGTQFYALGIELGRPYEFLCLMAMLCGLATSFYCYKIIQFFRFRGYPLVLGTALALCFPCLFISSWAPEADILLTAVMTAFIYYLLRYDARHRPGGLGAPVMLGVVAGLAMATKYNGLIALALAGQVTGLRLLLGRGRMKSVRDGLLILALCLALGYWRYLDNYERFGQVFHANGTAAEGFAFKDKKILRDLYDFHSLKLGELFKLLTPDAPPGSLMRFPVYNSVWTSLHAQAWGDMSFFTNITRHGTSRKLYPWRGIPLWLSGSVLVLGLLPTLLAAIGLAATLRRRRLRTLVLLLLTTFPIYFFWVISQETWALKTKYILFLLPAYILYTLFGLRWLERRAPRPLARAAAWAMVALVVLTHAYLYQFAVGLE